MNLTSRIANYEFENPFMNASGVMCYDEMELDQLLRSSAGAFVTKSATPDFREGNPSPRYVDVPLGSINSMGLPNKGFDFLSGFLLTFRMKIREKSISSQLQECLWKTTWRCYRK